MPYSVRRVRPEEWEAVRATRLASLRDPDAHLAFLDTYENASAQPDDFWRLRAANAAAGGAVCQQVVVGPHGGWVGSVTGLLEEAGELDFEGNPIAHRQVHVVGVWVHPDHRGRGLVQQAVDAVVGWARELGVSRVRLNVHADNHRAQAAYAKAGFSPSGATHEGVIGPELEMVREVHP